MKKWSIYLAFIVLSSSCGINFSNKTASLPGTWLLYDAKTGTADNDFSSEANLKKQVSDGDQFCFFKDGTFTEIVGKTTFNSGTWKMNSKNNVITITPDGGRVKDLNITMETTADKKERFQIELSHNGTQLQFVKEFEAMENAANDPYYKDNNTWRIKPSAPETDTQITERLANYIKHMALILKAAHDRKQQVVSFEHSMGIIKIYNGGIGINHFSIIPDNWKQTYFNDADAEKAYNMYNRYLDQSSYRGASSGDWFVDDYNILLSIYSDIHPGK